MSALPDRDDRVMTLLTAALALGADERSRYLRAASDGDEELLREIKDAIEWEERMGDFLQRPWLSLRDLEQPFKPGHLINERFEIVQEIGHGGMGIVYEAFDRKRGQRIAIKSAKLGFRRLLSPELESALRVRHQNVCLVNEIHTASTEFGDFDFLTMELLEGPTLQEVLSARGPLEPKEALEIAQQLCAGLAEAHRIGVVHKDLKTANVILTKTPDGSVRAVITDFGLAGEPAAGGGDVAGTPRYMAPELWRGAHASKASDIYALGVIFYEMVTGAAPFGDEPSEVRLTRRPPSVTSRAGHVDRRFDAVISRCLDPSPEARPRDAMEILGAVASRRFRKAPVFAALVLMAAMVAGITTWRKPAPNVRLAILPATGNATEIANGVLNDVADRLARREALAIMRREKLVEGDVHTPAQARANIDATHALQLALRKEGGNVLAHATVIDLATQTPLEVVSRPYAVTNAGDLSTALTGAVSKALKLRGDTEEPISPAAATAYGRGHFYLRRDLHSFDLALPLFREAVRLDPHAPQPRAGIVEALVLKYSHTKEERWLAEAERELEAARALDPDSIAVLLAAGRMDYSSGRYEKALESYRRVGERQPRNVEVWLRIAEVYDKLAFRKEAIQSYHRAIALDPKYYQTYQHLGVFHSRRGESEQAAEQFRKVVALAPRFQRAYVNLGASLSEIGQDDAATQALMKALSLGKTASALNSLAVIKVYQKRDDEAIALYKEAIALEPRNHIFLLNLADACRRRGKADESLEYYRRGRNITLDHLRKNARDGVARAYLATFEGRLGDHARGQQEIEQALQLAPEDKNVLRRAVLTYEMLGLRDRALAVASVIKPQDLRELARHPDMADFSLDPRFRELKAKNEIGG